MRTCTALGLCFYLFQDVLSAYSFASLQQCKSVKIILQHALVVRHEILLLQAVLVSSSAHCCSELLSGTNVHKSTVQGLLF